MFTKQSIKSSVPVITLVIGILFFTYGTFGHFEEPSKIKIYIAGIGSTLLSSGIFAVLLKSMQFMGVFKDELVNIIYKADYLNHRTDLAEIWENVSKVVFKNKFPKISKEITEDVRNIYFPTQHVLYYDNYQQTLEIELIDEENDIIKVTQYSRYTVYPTDRKEKFTHIASNRIKFNKDRAEIDFKIVEFNINSKKYSPYVTEYISSNDLLTTYSVDLKHEDVYKFETKIEKKYSLKFDNIIGLMKDFLIRNFELKVFLKGNLKLSFISAGTLQPFVKNTYSNSACYEFHYKGLIYPKQGYVLIIEKNS
ncbi:hypothetical protein SAMN05660461_3324 [Chitinophaga ginsengisegetis]|uniref:Uncharacterized protein n=1 Tax=Chitinophaga ginsengisegetis TaxID=393003 RepID=A0A1T5P0D8_9BACT|nr:hypothetical protein [Chitinophaga ginsengisegetis]SKD06152.1 hypothetical protein SAMN05660461_3324 [Chitinophaga ginsengisegetis]